MRSWLRIAHRGASAHAPENTLAAFRRAVEIGTDAVEMDVHLTADGHVVVLHDATLDRTTNGSGAVAERSLAEVRSVDAGSWFDAAFAGERIPTLHDVLDLLPQGVLALVEVKVDAATWPTVEILRERNRLDDAVLISFLPEVLRLVRWLEPRLPTSLLMGRVLDVSSPRANALAMLRAAQACGTSALNLHWRLTTAEVVETVHRRGGSVWTWTVDDPTTLQTLLEADVDGVASNYPERLNEAKERR